MEGKAFQQDNIMKMMKFEDFARDFGRAAKPTMNMSIYRDNFECACGKSHWFDDEIDIVCEGLMKVMVVCPQDRSFVTSLKIKTFMIVKFKGFESLAGSHPISSQDQAALMAIKSVVRA
jgi:hypothetical protein